MKRNKLQKTVFSVICIVLAVIMMLSLVITVLPAHAVDETDLERLAEKRAQLEEQLMEQEQVIQGLTENQTLIVFRKAALDKQISLNRETIALIEEQIAVYQKLIDRKEEELAAATAAETEQTALLRERIRSMEENDSYSYLAFIFEANSVPEILSRIADVNDIMHYDRELEKSLQQSREDVETIKREYEEAKAEQDAVNEELIARRDQLSAQVTAACELIANLDELSQNAQAEYDAIALAMTALEQANTILQNRFSPALGARTAEIFSALTGGRYGKVLLSRDLSLSAEEAGDPMSRSILQLSQGAADQLYLAVRLAICGMVLPAEKRVPLILDDALVTFDDTRLRAALDYLLAESAQRQILLFTCQNRERDYLAGRENVNILTL